MSHTNDNSISQHSKGTIVYIGHLSVFSTM